MRRLHLTTFCACLASLLAAAQASASTLIATSQNGFSNTVYRFDLGATGTPTSSTFSTGHSPGGAAFAPNGDLFIANFENQGVFGDIYHYTTPLGTPALKETISGSIFPTGVVFRGSELLVIDAGANQIQRYTFNGSNLAVTGTPITETGGDLRMGAFSPSGDLYVSHTGNKIDRFTFDAGGVATLASTITGNGLSVPHGLAFSPWGELFVAGEGNSTIDRLTLNASGAVTAFSTFSGNGLTNPVGLAFSSWGELFVGNQGTNGISRFTFDASHVVSPNGSFAVGTSFNGITFAADAAPVPEPAGLLLAVASLASVATRRARAHVRIASIGLSRAARHAG